MRPSARTRRNLPPSTKCCHQLRNDHGKRHLSVKEIGFRIDELNTLPTNKVLKHIERIETTLFTDDHARLSNEWKKCKDMMQKHHREFEWAAMCTGGKRMGITIECIHCDTIIHEHWSKNEEKAESGLRGFTTMEGIRRSIIPFFITMTTPDP